MICAAGGLEGTDLAGSHGQDGSDAGTSFLDGELSGFCHGFLRHPSDWSLPQHPRAHVGPQGWSLPPARGGFGETCPF